MREKETKLSAYNIDIYKLPNKVYEYQYEIGQDFFSNFENSLIEKGNLQASVVLDKQETLLSMRFYIEGTVELECDRSLEKFDHPVHIDEKILFQYGQEEEELTEEIVVITQNTQRINVAQYLYEFIGLAVPMKKLHPKYAQDENPFAEGEIIYTSTQEQIADETIDPRWDILKKLKK